MFTIIFLSYTMPSAITDTDGQKVPMFLGIEPITCWSLNTANKNSWATLMKCSQLPFCYFHRA